MSFYNLIFGKNPLSDIYLYMLGLDQSSVGRFRDCYLTKDDSGESSIVVYTRNGGGNRECYCESESECADYCLSSIIGDLRDHPNYITDYDDDFDCTYASFVFSVPDGCEALVEKLSTVDQMKDPENEFKVLLEDLSKGDLSKPAAKRAMAVGEALFKRISEDLAK